MEGRKHDTIKRRNFKYDIQTNIHVVNTTDFDIDVDIVYDIDEYKIIIKKK